MHKNFAKPGYGVIGLKRIRTALKNTSSLGTLTKHEGTAVTRLPEPGCHEGLPPPRPKLS